MEIATVHTSHLAMANTATPNQDTNPRHPSPELMKRLAYLVRYSPNTVMIADSEGVIEYVNTVFTSLTGYLYEEVINRRLDEFNLHEKSSMPGFSWPAILQGEIWQGEVTSYKKSGEPYFEQALVLAVTDEAKGGSWVAFIKQNISERKRVERELRALTETLANRIKEQRNTEIELAVLNRQNELILNSVAEGIFGVDVEGSITFVNATAEKLTGYRGADVFGIPYPLFFQRTREDGSRFDQAQCPIQASFRDGKFHQSLQEIFVREDGTSFPVHLASAPIIEDETVIGAVVLFKDITEELRSQQEKQKAEQQLRQLTATLDERVKKRTAQLNAANHDLLNTLDQLQKTQNQLVESEKMASLGGLVAGVAHEINTPVGIAYTAATHLDKETRQLIELYRSGKMSRTDFEAYLSMCQESTTLLQSNLNRAGELIRSFKQVAIDQSMEAKRTFHLRSYTDEVLRSLRPLLKKTQLEIRVNGDEELKLSSYPGALSQILTNLITNSITHAYAEGGQGKIRLDFSREGSTLSFQFSDDGRGIAASDLPHIFEPFYTTGRNRGGSGLGLYIVYNLITQKLSGTIACRSKPGEGTSFDLRIPLE